MKRILQNASICSPRHLRLLPTIIIREGEPGFPEAYENWRQQKNPTDSPEWKNGVYYWVDRSQDKAGDT